MKRVVKLLVILSILLGGVHAALAAPPAKTGGAYTVRPGDCLAKLAEKFYGNQRFWPAIWQATNNRALTDSRFTMISNPDLIHSGQILWLPAGVEPLLIESGSAQTDAAADAPGLLTVDIVYTGQFYRETFNYSKDAPNIRHVAVVVPAAYYEANHHTPGHICSSLTFTGANEPLQFRSDIRGGVAWDLSVLHPVPYQAELKPGRYYVGGCFIAAPLSREEAGVSDDAILYAGITGGGASSDYQVVTIEPGGRRDITIFLADRDGWACPWVYVFNGQTFARRSEILRNLNAKTLETTQRTPLGAVTVQDGIIRLQIREEKPETTYLDALYLEVAGTPVWPEPRHGLLVSVDQNYLVLRPGDVYELTFDVSAIAGDVTGVEAVIVSTGYYQF